MGLSKSNAKMNLKLSEYDRHGTVSFRYEPLDPRSSFVMSDELPAKIMSGKVVVKPGVARFTRKEAIFTDGTRELVDCVICTSGYDTQFPYISNDILPGKLGFMLRSRFHVV